MKDRMKKIYISVLVTTMATSLVACGGTKSDTQNKEENAGAQAVELILTSETEIENIVQGMSSGTAEKRDEYAVGYAAGVYEADFFKKLSQIDNYGEYEYIDAEGQMVLSKETIVDDYNYHVWYLGDGYFLLGSPLGSRTIIKDGKAVLESIPVEDAYYNDGVFYCSSRRYDSLPKITAYDLEKNEELWSIDFEPIAGSSVEYINEEWHENYIEVETGNTTQFVSYDGEVIVEGTDIYPTESEYYLKVSVGNPVQVYDLANNLVSQSDVSISIENLDFDTTSGVEFRGVLPNGMYTLCERTPNPNDSWNGYDNHYKLYTINSEVVKESDELIVQNDDYTHISAVHLGGDWDESALLKADGTGFLMEEPAKIYGESEFSTDCKRDNFIFYSRYDEETRTDIKQIINLHTEEMLDIDYEETSIEEFVESPEASYIVAYNSNVSNANYYVYDSEFNELYVSSNTIRPVDEETLLEIDDSGKISLVEIATGEKTPLEVDGEYHSHISSGLVTYDGEKYYLYAFR